MENLLVNRDGSIRVRPGLRHLATEWNGAYWAPFSQPIIGSHEAFYLNDGSLAYLVAVREAGEPGEDVVTFRVIVVTPLGEHHVQSLTEAGFSVPAGVDTLTLPSTTTYVKYLQIDNKILALSNGNALRYFDVGTTKIAKTLQSIDRPEWTVEDKCSVVKPPQAWINNLGTLLSTRTNWIQNPSFEGGAGSSTWYADASGIVDSTLIGGAVGRSALLINTVPADTNLVHRPLGDVNTYGTVGWAIGAGTASLTVDGPNNAMKITSPSTGAALSVSYANGEQTALTPNVPYPKPGANLFVAATFKAATNVNKIGIMVRFYTGAGGTQVGSDRWLVETNPPGAGAEVRAQGTVAIPAGATYFAQFPYFKRTTANVTASISIKDVKGTRAQSSYVQTEYASYPDVYSPLDGDDSDAYVDWEGAPNDSPTYRHPPDQLMLAPPDIVVAPPGDYNLSFYAQVLSGTPRAFDASLEFYSIWFPNDYASLGTPSVGSWSRLSGALTYPAPYTPALPPGTPEQSVSSAQPFIRVENVERGDRYAIDAVLMEKTATLQNYFDGSTSNTLYKRHAWAGTANGSPSIEQLYAAPNTLPAGVTNTANTLISNDAMKNIYNFGFFYTFSTEIGESAASQVTVVKTQRGWSSWKWETSNAAGEPSGTATDDPALCADQLVVIAPPSVFAQAKTRGATRLNLYMFTWSGQDTVPVTATLVGTKDLSPTSLYVQDGWVRVTPQMNAAGSEIAVVPSEYSRYNSTNPSKAANGLVAADRMILVLDPTAGAVIRWTSNQQGKYTSFSPSLGGGYKTLTSGNLYVPASVKLWQNPQSVDTLTILCLGTDGYSAGYYMAPAEVNAQSESTAIMGFEETTATPGTVSPFGVEVVNNALYHPLESQLMKSTANNYNITHKSMSELISNKWINLVDKDAIVSCQIDNRIYYVVHNPDGEPLHADCRGNEIWVYDTATETGTWSRFLIQAQSIRKMLIDGIEMLSITRFDGLYALDPRSAVDWRNDMDGGVGAWWIDWKLETNTQGANRAHDAWARLQQASLTAGNLNARFNWGIRGWDVNGKLVDVNKQLRPPPGNTLIADMEDHLQVRRDLKEWVFYASSVDTGLCDEPNIPQMGFAQISLVQYRYTPVSVNVGYEFGSVETFEYGRAGNASEQSGRSQNGIPLPYVDRRPG